MNDLDGVERPPLPYFKKSETRYEKDVRENIIRRSGLNRDHEMEEMTIMAANAVLNFNDALLKSVASRLS